MRTLTDFLDTFPVVTFTAVVGVLVGAEQVLVENVSLPDFYEQAGIFLAGLGVVGIARGLAKR